MGERAIGLLRSKSLTQRQRVGSLFNLATMGQSSRNVAPKLKMIESNKSSPQKKKLFLLVEQKSSSNLTQT